MLFSAPTGGEVDITTSIVDVGGVNYLCDVGFGGLDERIELRDLDGIVPLFALTEAEDVGLVGRAATVEEEGVLAP